MLREALESVRRQTARQAIQQVVVSENCTANDSKTICDEFRDLPITYVQQKPPVSELNHLKQIWGLVRCPRVAFLHDDDWWLPEHLQAALTALEANDDCAAVFANFYDTGGPSHPFQVSNKAWRVWIGADCDFSKPVLLLDDVAVFLSCLLDASFHYSTLVGRSDAVWAAYTRLVATGNPFDTDRTFPIFLGAHGRVAYLTKPSAMIRRHAGQAFKRPEYKYKSWQLKSETTKWLLQTERAKVFQAAARFNSIAKRVPPGLFAEMCDVIGEPQRSTLIEDCGFDLIPGYVQTKPKWLINQICPPALLALAKRLINRARPYSNKTAKSST
jgi:hypothetical protein